MGDEPESSDVAAPATAPPADVVISEDNKSHGLSKDEQIAKLQKQLAHYRLWLNTIHSRVLQMNPQAVKNSKRLYIGGMPDDATEDELKQFLTDAMFKTGAATGPGQPVLCCKMTSEKGYAFAEFRSIEEASNALALDGVVFRDDADNHHLKIRRPSNYDLATALMLGPTTPDPTIDTSHLHMCRTTVEDSPHKLFVGGLPCDWNEEQVKGLISQHGTIRSFNLVMDKSTGKSKGYAFCEFTDEAASDIAIAALHNRKVGSKVLTVKRALEGASSVSSYMSMAALMAGGGVAGGGKPPPGFAASGPMGPPMAGMGMAGSYPPPAHAGMYAMAGGGVPPLHNAVAAAYGLQQQPGSGGGGAGRGRIMPYPGGGGGMGGGMPAHMPPPPGMGPGAMVGYGMTAGQQGWHQGGPLSKDGSSGGRSSKGW